MSPAIQAIQNKCHRLKEGELKRILSVSAGLSEYQVQLIEKGLDSLVRKILNDPILFLQSGSATRERQEIVALLLNVFGIRWDDADYEDLKPKKEGNG